MLRIVVSPNAAAAKKYFTGGLSAGDYFIAETHETGTWGGKGAELLSLAGPVDRMSFQRLCDNLTPITGLPLTARTNADRRVGYDLNFHCPKSVSLVHALTGDKVILESFRVAVAETMALIEAEAKTRVRVGGAQYDRPTGNLVWATFVHSTSRPIRGIPDPHLHAHCFTFNATLDNEEGRWKAAQFGDVKRDGAYFEACFHAKLANLLQQAGYGVERQGRFWEIAGIPDGLIEKFSRRTTEIESIAKQRGITDPKLKAELGATTRRSKEESKSNAEVWADWQSRVSPIDKAALFAVRMVGRRGDKTFAPRDAIDFALDKGFERASVLSERSVLESALRYGVGTVSRDALEKELAARPLLRRDLDGRPMISTREILQEEQAVLDFARSGRGTCPSFHEEVPKAKSSSLSKQQQAAVAYLATSTDRVMVVRGRAGTGKTTLLREAEAMMERAGKSVHVFAPSAEASRGVLRREGFKEAETVSKLLSDTDVQRRARNQVLWVDEAGLLGTKSMRSLFELAEKINARVILSGDSKQHRSVERGDALRLLEQHAGLGTAQLSEIHRQSGEYRSAVEALAEGRVRDGFARLDKLGAIQETKPSEGHSAIAKEYVQTIRGKKSALIVSPTHAEGREVTQAVRDRMKAERLLGKSKTFERLQSLGLTESDRRDGRNFHSGHVVQFYQAAKGFKAGSKYDIVGHDPFGNVLARKGAFVEALPLSKADRFDVFERQQIEIAKGDVLRITRNGRTVNEAFGPEKLLSPSAQHKLFNTPLAKLAGVERSDRRYRLENGSLHRVAGFTLGGNIKLENGYVVEKTFGHLAHGYCVTSHASQGKTVDRVLIAQSTASLGAASAEQFYVSASRARERVTVFTDDKARLLEAVTKTTERVSASELVHRAKGDDILSRGNSPTLPKETEKERDRER